MSYLLIDEMIGSPEILEFFVSTTSNAMPAFSGSARKHCQNIGRISVNPFRPMRPLRPHVACGQGRRWPSESHWSFKWYFGPRGSRVLLSVVQLGVNGCLNWCYTHDCESFTTIFCVCGGYVKWGPLWVVTSNGRCNT